MAKMPMDTRETTQDLPMVLGWKARGDDGE